MNFSLEILLLLCIAMLLISNMLLIIVVFRKNRQMESLRKTFSSQINKKLVSVEKKEPETIENKKKYLAFSEN